MQNIYIILISKNLKILYGLKKLGLVDKHHNIPFTNERTQHIQG